MRAPLLFFLDTVTTAKPQKQQPIANTYVALTECQPQFLALYAFQLTNHKTNLPRGSVGKESAWNAGEAEVMGSITRSGTCPGEGHDNVLQYPCLENPMDRRLAGYSPQGHKESDMTEATLNL